MNQHLPNTKIIKTNRNTWQTLERKFKIKPFYLNSRQFLITMRKSLYDEKRI